MPNGDFRFLLNYLDHSVKFLFGIPLKRKQASCVAIALLKIFTVIGPPMILQPDNCQEFSGAAVTSHERRGLCVGLNAVELNEVINEIKLLWPECRTGCGLPRRSPSNGGVERLNRMMEEKLGAWMAETGSTNWSIGCRLMMWADVDKAKVDNSNLTGVFVKINAVRMKAHVVVKAWLLKPWYDYHKLSRVRAHGNSIKLLGLGDAFVNWHKMKVVSKCEASRKESFVGGQGKGTVICSCKGACDSNKFKCFKEARICSSACHCNNAKCKNHDMGG